MRNANEHEMRKMLKNFLFIFYNEKIRENPFNPSHPRSFLNPIHIEN